LIRDLRADTERSEDGKATSAMRFMRSLPMNARLFFLTLPADNLPESGERQYQNKGTCARSRRDGFNHGTNEKKKNFTAIFSAKQNASAVSGATQHRNPTQAA
jgi:hypothetical protein